MSKPTDLVLALKSLGRNLLNRASAPGADDPANIRPVVIAGFTVIALFFGLFGTWAAVAPLDSAAIAPGVVSVETSRRTIQHLEGGIIADILVDEGDRVSRDDILVRLDDTGPRASRDLLAGRLIEALAREARLVAERDNVETISFSRDELASLGSDAADQAITGQVSIMASRRRAAQEREAILQQRIAQLNEQIAGLKGEIKSEERQIELLDEELADVRDLVEKGLARKPRLLALERGLAEIEGNRSRNRAAIAEAHQAIGETELRINEGHSLQQSEVLQALRDTQSALADLRERLLAAEAVLDRTRIRSMIEGTVVDLRVHTTGGVIRPGEAIMDIVPRNDRLVIEVWINPQDIDVVAPGLAAHVSLTAFSRRNAVPLVGTLTTISADLLQNEQTGAVYYLGRVELDSAQEGLLDGPTLYPGMQAEVMILTGDNTLLNYLLRPITRSLRRAMRDG